MGNNSERVMEWEQGLPNGDDLTPLSQSLIPSVLALAFSISPEAHRTANEVNQASQDTLSSIRGNNFVKSSREENNKNRESFGVEYDTIADDNDDVDESEARKIRRFNSPEEADLGTRMDDFNDDNKGKSSTKRHRLVWTPQLHKRFVEVVAHLGIKNAVPKTIMQLMNVEGLTRENVASHLQKYRLYLKRKEGLPNDDPSSSDPLFESTPVPHSVRESSASDNGHGHVSMPYPPPMMQMPGFGVGHGHMGMQFGNPNAGYYQGFESHPYNILQQRNWPSYPHISPNKK